MLSQVQYLNRKWNVAMHGAGYLLTYAEAPPEHLAGRVIFVDVDGCVYECSRDGLNTVGPKFDNPPDPLRDESAVLAAMGKRNPPPPELDLVKQRAVVAHWEQQPKPKHLHQRITEG